MPARHIDIEIDRIVLDGVALKGADIEAMRVAITAELTGWLSELDIDVLRAGATPRVAAPTQTLASLADGRALGRSVARAVRDAVAPAGAPLKGARPARSRVRQGFGAQEASPAKSGEPR